MVTITWKFKRKSLTTDIGGVTLGDGATGCWAPIGGTCCFPAPIGGGICFPVPIGGWGDRVVGTGEVLAFPFADNLKKILEQI